MNNLIKISCYDMFNQIGTCVSLHVYFTNYTLTINIDTFPCIFEYFLSTFCTYMYMYIKMNDKMRNYIKKIILSEIISY